MPAPEPGVRRDGDALVFSGVLSRAHVPALWREAGRAGTGLARIDLTAVERVDSAGLALLSLLATHGPGPVTITGSPPGLAELGRAYRLGPMLAFSAAAADPSHVNGHP